jgi:hypothetical protein
VPRFLHLNARIAHFSMPILGRFYLDYVISVRKQLAVIIQSVIENLVIITSPEVTRF